MQATTMQPNKALPLDFGATGADPQQLRAIPLVAIHTDGDFTVRRLDAEALDDLAKSLEIVGQLQPIGVRAAGANWNLVYGERRVRAARLLNWGTLLARVYPPVGAAAVVLRATENMHRQEFSLEDAAATVLRLVEAGMSPPSIAKALARRESWVTGMLSLARNPLARDLASLGRLQSVSAWEEFSSLDAAQQRGIVESSDVITVARCEAARKACQQQSQKRQQKLLDAPPQATHPTPAEAPDEQEAEDVSEESSEPVLKVRVSAALYRALKQISEQEHRSEEDVLREALDAWFATHPIAASHV